MVHMVVFFSCKSGGFHPPQLHHLIFLGGQRIDKLHSRSPEILAEFQALFKFSKSRHFSRSSALSKSVCEVSGMLGVPTSKL